MLGGKTIAELDANGVKTKGYVYSGGSRIATQTITSGTQSVQIESTNPVTGASLTTDVNGIGVSQAEPDPLGRDLISAPDPTVIGDPLASSKWNEPMPIEYTGGPSAEYQKANADWASDMALRGLAIATNRKNNYKATAQLILEKNPNIGIRPSEGRSLYGSDAANYLHDLHGEFLGGDTLTADEASATGGQQNSYQVERAAAQKAIETIKDKKGCRDFLSRLVSLTSASLNLKVVGGDPGLALDLYIQAIDAGRVRRSNASGDNQKGQTTYGVTTNHSTVEWNDEFYNRLDDSERGVHTIHESLHQIFGFTDQVLAVAASILQNPGRPMSFEYKSDGLRTIENLKRQAKSQRDC